MKEKLVSISERILSAKGDLEALVEELEKNPVDLEDSTAIGDIDSEVDQLIDLKDRLMEFVKY